MDTTTAAIVGASIAASSGLIGALTTAFLGGWRQERLEADKRKWALKDARLKQLEDTITQLTTKIAAAVHSMCWIAWIAMESPTRLTQEQSDLYDKEMHAILPDITALSAVLGSLDATAYSMTEPTIQSIFKMDAETGRACLHIANEHDVAIRELIVLYQKFLDAQKRVPTIMSEVISDASERLRG
jgi:hypothetical protein